jgi:hypothetical protein
MPEGTTVVKVKTGLGNTITVEVGAVVAVGVGDSFPVTGMLGCDV